MKIVAISDTHNYKPVLPDGDLLIHCGDITMRGTEKEVFDNIKWLSKQRGAFSRVLLVPGNHDDFFERSPDFVRKLYQEAGITLLMHESTEIDGIKIFGSPYTPRFHDWAFNVDRWNMHTTWAAIPTDTNILITHGPPAYILDKCRNGNVGCADLEARIQQLPALRAHFFGHIHESAGFATINKVLFLNASVLNGFYNSYDCVYSVDYETLQVTPHLDGGA